MALAFAKVVKGNFYCGRIAPTPTGFLHAGHALTFWTAFQRAQAADGCLLLRFEDLDIQRCRSKFVEAAMEDLHWLGIRWNGEPVFQSSRRGFYLEAWKQLRDSGWIYPCQRSRKDVASASLAPHEEEPIFPIKWRANRGEESSFPSPNGTNWRFRVPDGEHIIFRDGQFGHIQRTALRDFGDFVIWNRDDIPAYELAVVVDDIDMGITEVVRGVDLLTSTARQILLYQALAATLPQYYHCPLVHDSAGHRLAKRNPGLGIRDLRNTGFSPSEVIALAKQFTAKSIP